MERRLSKNFSTKPHDFFLKIIIIKGDPAFAIVKSPSATVLVLVVGFCGD